MSLRERWEFVCDAIDEGYLLCQWSMNDNRTWLATYKNREIGVFVDEILDVMNGECEI